MKQGQLYAWKLDFNQSYQFDQYPFLSQGFEYPIILLPYTCMKVQSMQSDLEFKYNTHEHDNQVPINSIYVLQYQDDYILSTFLVPTMTLTLPNPMELNAARSSMRLRCASGEVRMPAPVGPFFWSLPVLAP
jgi:hypothetical protein